MHRHGGPMGGPGGHRGGHGPMGGPGGHMGGHGGGRPPMPPRRFRGFGGGYRRGCGCLPGCMMYVLGIGAIIAFVLSLIF